MWKFGWGKRAATSETCSRHPAFPNLFVLPYVRGRLVFAHMAAKAIEEGGVDRLLVDLPAFMSGQQWLGAPLGLFPLVSSLIVHKGKGPPALFAFAPSDAACLSAYLAIRKPLPLACVDDSNYIHYPEGHLFQPDVPLEDDYYASTGSAGEYFSASWREMDRLWDEAPFMQRCFTDARASVVADRLRQALERRGDRILFVCEWRLWWAVNRRLAENAPPLEVLPAEVPWEDRPAALVAEDPYLLWARGLFDDYPHINLELFEAAQRGEAASFDKLAELRKILAGSKSAGALRSAGDPSVRLLIAFERYLKARVSAARRLTPLPAAHLLDAAASCVGREFAAHLAKALIKYPTPRDMESGPKPAWFRVTQSAMADGTAAFDVPDLFHSGPYYGGAPCEDSQFLPEEERRQREQWWTRLHPSITRQEQEKMGQGFYGIRWAVREDYRFHETACSYVREVARRASAETRVVRSWGSLKDGIHWKATLASMARGENVIYARQKRRNSRLGRLDEYTPVVFLLTEDIGPAGASTVHDSNITQRCLEMGKQSLIKPDFPPPDMVYSVYMTSTRTEGLWSYHVQRENVTSLAFLYTRQWMGLDRYAAIARRPRRYQCRQSPTEDGEVCRFRATERGIAWAIKYAQGTVLVVAPPDWKASAALVRFAANRRVRIVTVPLTSLDPAVVRKLGRMHFISTNLKTCDGYEEIVSRFVQ